MFFVLERIICGEDVAHLGVVLQQATMLCQILNGLLLCRMQWHYLLLLVVSAISCIFHTYSHCHSCQACAAIIASQKALAGRDIRASDRPSYGIRCHSLCAVSTWNAGKKYFAALKGIFSK